MLIVISVAAVVLAAMVVWYSPLQLQQRIGMKNFFGAALLAAWLAGIGANAYEARRAAEPVGSDLMAAVRSIGPIDWDGTSASGQRATASSAGTQSRLAASDADPGMEVAPVAALIGGLEARLAQDPEDPQGWALLAQSYAFTGRTDDANAAASRAVELGFDESSLRSRVQAATRELHSGNWIEHAIRP